MKTALGIATTFVAGFAACALVLQLTQRGGAHRDARVLPSGRHALSQALSQLPAGNHSPAVLSGLPSVADAVARIAPAVVNIDIEGRQIVPGRGLLGSLMPQEQPFEGAGSGVILSPDGYVLTNHHVVVSSAGQTDRTMTATLSDGKRYPVIVVGRDPASDLAVLKLLGAKDLTPVRLANSDLVRTGDWVIAVGNPMGFNSSVTLGIVSGLNRRYPRHDSVALEKIIQTDAAIHPGSSGGALADIEGQVIGINTAIATTTGAGMGIGFAIPINAARKIAAELIEKGRVVRPYLGVVYSPLAELNRSTVPSHVPLPAEAGGMVVYASVNHAPITEDSPAQKCGLREWDVLLEADDKPLRTQQDLREQIAAHKVGDALRLRVWREGQELFLTAILEEMPEGFGQEN